MGIKHKTLCSTFTTIYNNRGFLLDIKPIWHDYGLSNNFIGLRFTIYSHNGKCNGEFHDYPTLFGVFYFQTNVCDCILSIYIYIYGICFGSVCALENFTPNIFTQNILSIFFQSHPWGWNSLYPKYAAGIIYIYIYKYCFNYIFTSYILKYGGNSFHNCV